MFARGFRGVWSHVPCGMLSIVGFVNSMKTAVGGVICVRVVDAIVCRRDALPNSMLCIKNYIYAF